ncbi:hypothetical protein ACWFNE_20295 [Cellulomonas sp. NPDC055163]
MRDAERAKELLGDVPAVPFDGMYPDEMLAELRKTTRSKRALASWLSAAEAAIAASVTALRSVRETTAVGVRGELIFEPGLPDAWVIYPPRRYGVFLGYSKHEEGPFRLCACARAAFDAVAHGDEAFDADGVSQTRRDVPVSPAVLQGRSFDVVLDDDDSWGTSLCHRCNSQTPALRYRSTLSRFRQHHEWFIAQEWLASDTDGVGETEDMVSQHEVENTVRASFGVPAIGTWKVSETLLYEMIKQLVPSERVERCVRPSWLGGLELDIWIPELSLAVEYQGEQHFRPVEHWGGKDALDRQQERDARKVALCRDRKVTLIHFDYDEPLTPQHVLNRLGPFIGPPRVRP